MLDLRDLAHWLIDQVQQHSGRADAFAYRYAPWLERSPVSPLLVLGATFAVLAAVQVLLVSRVPADEAPVSVSIPCPPQAEAGWRGDLLSHPHIRSSGHPDLITAYDPATAYHIADVPADTPPSIAAKLAAAHAAADAWADASFARRRRVLRTLQRWLVTDMESIARVAARDTGKTAIDAAFGELLTTASKLEWTITYGEPVLRPQTRRNNLLLAHKVSRVTHQPLGVVLACVSWNYSAHNALGPIIASLFAGNAVVIKASELVAWSATWYINAVRTCLDACGENKELVQIVTCFPEHAEHLTTSPIVKHITFIGSEAVGRKVAQAAATEITPVTLELGGKDPAVLTASADLKFFASTFMRSCFQGAGQNCIGIERFIVHHSLVAPLLEIVQPRIAALKCGSFMDDAPFGRSATDKQEQEQVDVGAMITDARFEHLESLIADAVSRGARLLVGGKRLRHPKWTGGHYFEPTLLTDVTTDMPIAQEELFAPVFLVLPFREVGEAIRMANGTRYGLGSSIFGSDRAECEAIAARLHAGMVNINDFGVSYLNQHLPFGGVKKSGYGRFGGPEGLLALTSPKAITHDRLFRTIRTGIPPPLDYPLANPHKSWSFVQGLVRFAYAEHLADRLDGIRALITAAF